jgi:UDP-N-acetylglucosamine:LPS N-acetylglucosamine transferase
MLPLWAQLALILNCVHLSGVNCKVWDILSDITIKRHEYMYSHCITLSGRRSDVSGYTMTLIMVVREVLFSRSRRKGTSVCCVVFQAVSLLQNMAQEQVIKYFGFPSLVSFINQRHYKMLAITY